MAKEGMVAGDDLSRLRDYVDRIARSPSRRLPSEPKLSAELDVSRGRLRTLLKRLEAEGLIWRHVGKGTFVGPRRLTSDDRNWTDSVSVDAFFDARMLLEPQLAAHAALNATAADVVAMESCLADMAGAEAFVPWKQLDEKLHRIIAVATHNVLLLILYDTIRCARRRSRGSGQGWPRSTAMSMSRDARPSGSIAASSMRSGRTTRPSRKSGCARTCVRFGRRCSAPAGIDSCCSIYRIEPPQSRK